MTGFEPAASTSQTSRATNCATPRSVKNIRFLVNFRKWSNLWSKHFVGVFFEKTNTRKSQCLQGCFLNDCKAFRGFAFRAERVFARGGVPAACMLPNVARSLLPFPHRASLVRSRSATAATPFSSLLPPQAALGNVPSCATPRKEKNIEFLRFFRKWSNMWSKSYAEAN